MFIYNILVEEVAQIVNQQLKAGFHEVDFNNTIYASGIYFYRIQVISAGSTDNFVETKKMLLLK